jgi:hypothetical protein
MAKRYRLSLTDEERERLQGLTRNGTASVWRVWRAQTLLLAAEERIDEDIAKVLHIGVAMVERTRRQFVERGLEVSLRKRSRRDAPPIDWWLDELPASTTASSSSLMDGDTILDASRPCRL